VPSSPVFALTEHRQNTLVDNFQNPRHAWAAVFRPDKEHALPVYLDCVTPSTVLFTVVFKRPLLLRAAGYGQGTVTAPASSGHKKAPP